MSNMSYCRFRNTLRDLRDCHEALEDVANGKGKLSDEELTAAQELVVLAAEIVANVLEAAGRDVDEEAILDQVIDRELDDAIARLNDDADDEE